MPRTQAAIITIGDEVLNGSTLDTNSHWLCTQIAGRGALVTTVVTVHDDPIAIKDALAYCMRTKPNLIFTIGGLGPTIDDRTVESVAQALELPLEVNQTAVEYVQQRYRDLESRGVVDHDVSASARNARQKMAVLPTSAVPIYNPVGAAPAVVINVDDTMSVLCLPGVPAEVRAIVSKHASDILERRLGSGFLRTMTIMTSTNDESVLAEASAVLTGEFPDVYVKTRPIRKEGGKIGVTLTTSGNDQTKIGVMLDAAFRRLTALLEGYGISIVRCCVDDAE
ncbi:MAG: competence/damage-inducible protein A [Candidatus Saccharibacteria bacterium]|nr:competence/damage-inducible protein A [Candidatus Saccharibacteria bacterium]